MEITDIFYPIGLLISCVAVYYFAMLNATRSMSGAVVILFIFAGIFFYLGLYLKDRGL